MVTPIPVDKAVFDLIQTRKEQVNKYHQDFLKQLRELEVKATVTGGTVVGDVPAAPPAL